MKFYRTLRLLKNHNARDYSLTSFRLVYGREARTMLDLMLPCSTEDEVDLEAELFAQRAEEGRQQACIHIQRQQVTDARHYDMHRREVD